MNENSLKKDDSTSASLMELLRKYTARVDESDNSNKDTTRTSRPEQKSKEKILYNSSFYYY